MAFPIDRRIRELVAIKTSGQITFPASSVNLQSLVCGPSRSVGLPHTPVLSYPVDMRRDLLIIYNSNLAASTAMLNYYQSQRRFAGLAPKLGISLDASLKEVLSTGLYTNTFRPAIENWYATHPTARPAYILLMYGVPNVPTPFLLNGVAQPDTQTGIPPTGTGSLQNDLREFLGVTYQRRPYLSALNFNLTNDCTHYIDKLASVGASNSLNCVVLSADKAGSVRDTYVLDNVINESTLYNHKQISQSRQSLLNIGTISTSILYRSSNPGSDSAVTTAMNIYSYVSWGGYNFTGNRSNWATLPSVTYTGDSYWYAFEALESVNGQWIPQLSQQSYLKWFSQYAFGGTTWNRTPITATSTVYEPTPYGVAQPETWLPLWATGHTASTSFWLSKPLKRIAPAVNENYFQVTGDPIVRR